jgi:hypothetical protein
MNNTFHFSDTELNIVISALHVAALSYAIDAHTHAETKRLYDAFLQQSHEANELAAKLQY